MVPPMDGETKEEKYYKHNKSSLHIHKSYTLPKFHFAGLLFENLKTSYSLSNEFRNLKWSEFHGYPNKRVEMWLTTYDPKILPLIIHIQKFVYFLSWIHKYEVHYISKLMVYVGNMIKVPHDLDDNDRIYI